MTKKVFGRECFSAFFALFLSVAILLFASECSPLYPFNDWYDANCFLTVGRKILRGGVPCRDIYEQKGPYVYFLHALCAAIDGDSFFGVWLAEIAACFLFLLSVCKTLRLYGIEDVGLTAAITALTGLSVYFSFAFSTGDSVEEFCLPLLSWPMYFSLKRIRTDGEFRFYDHLFIGVAAGLVFWSKFTVVGFFVAWYLFFLFHVVRNRRWKEIGVSVGFILSGVVIATLPCLIYFSANGAVRDWLRVYLYDNLFLYRESGNLFVRLGKTLLYILGKLGANVQYNFFVWLGVVGFARKRGKERAEEKAFLLIVPAVTALFLYIGGRGYRYYGLPLAIFAVCGYAFLAERGFGIRGRAKRALVPAAALASCLLFMGINGNFTYLFREKEDTAQYRFAEVINEKENSTLLNYGFLDGGFYLAAGKVPDFKYFCALNIPLPEMRQETEGYIREGAADFIVVKVWMKNPREPDLDKYREVMRAEERYREQKVTYILYEKI